MYQCIYVSLSVLFSSRPIFAVFASLIYTSGCMHFLLTFNGFVILKKILFGFFFIGRKSELLVVRDLDQCFLVVDTLLVFGLLGLFSFFFHAFL